MREQILIVIGLLLGISLLSALSDRLRISTPILLVIAGLLISIIPGVPVISLDPDLVFLIFLPPLLYGAAWVMPWSEFWKWKRAIFMLAFGLVVFSSVAVAFIAKWLIPGFTLGLGFLLGGIISPTDAVAATSVLKDLNVSKRLGSVLEGESLINDASGLIIYRFAMIAIVTGQFKFWDVSRSFLVVTCLGVLIGLAVALVFYLIHRVLTSTPRIDGVLTLISPYIMYITAEHFGFSGVLAVVSGGLFLASRSHEIYSYETRIKVTGLWEILVFTLNGLVFILIGLQLPVIVKAMDGYSISNALLFSLIISIVIIVIRIVWIFPAAYIPPILFKSIRSKESTPRWQSLLLAGWCGMRGVVSLAAALAIPLTMNNGPAFPYRNLILFITFFVILFTLVLQGLGLKPLIRLLKIRNDHGETEKTQLIALRVRLAESVLAYLDTNYPEETQSHEAYKRLRDRYERMIDIARRRLESKDFNEESGTFLQSYHQLLLELVQIRRRELNDIRYKKEFDTELILEIQRDLDLEEARLHRGKNKGIKIANPGLELH
jgi:CPA1 family monovalent cation:H+ antiporter